MEKHNVFTYGRTLLRRFARALSRPHKHQGTIMFLLIAFFCAAVLALPDFFGMQEMSGFFYFWIVVFAALAAGLLPDENEPPD